MYVPPHRLKATRPQPYHPPPKKSMIQSSPPAVVESNAPPPPIVLAQPHVRAQPHVPELRIFKPWYRYQLLSAKIAATQVIREEYSKVTNKISNENQRVQEMFEMREDAFDIHEALEGQEKKIQQMGGEALNDLNCQRGYEDHVFMRTGLHRIDHNIVDIEEKIERTDRLLAREAVMCAQLEDCLYDFVERANLSSEEKENWEAQKEATAHTSRFLKVHSQDLEFAMGEAKSLGLEDLQREVETRRCKGEKGYALMERLEEDFFKHITTFTDEKDDLMLLKELFDEFKQVIKDMTV